MNRVQLSGPLFQGAARSAVRGALEAVLDEAGRAGVKAVQDQLSPGHGVDTGDFERSLRHKRAGLSTAVESTQPAKAAWLQGTSRRNRTSSYKGIQPFTKGAVALERRAGEIARKAANDLARELGG